MQPPNALPARLPDSSDGPTGYPSRFLLDGGAAQAMVLVGVRDSKGILRNAIESGGGLASLPARQPDTKIIELDVLAPAGVGAYLLVDMTDWESALFTFEYSGPATSTPNWNLLEPAQGALSAEKVDSGGVPKEVLAGTVGSAPNGATYLGTLRLDNLAGMSNALMQVTNQDGVNPLTVTISMRPFNRVSA